MQKILLGLAVTLFLLIAYMHMSSGSEFFQTSSQSQKLTPAQRAYRQRMRNAAEDKINPGWGDKLGRMENQVTDPLDPRLWKLIAQRAGQYDGGFADVVMKLEDRSSIPSIKNLSVE